MNLKFEMFGIKKIMWLVGVAMVGFIFIFLVPPFQKPDETTHYYRMITAVSWIRSFPKAC